MTHPTQPLCVAPDCGRPTQGYLCNGHTAKLDRLLTEEEAVAALDAIGAGSDPEAAHGDADRVLLAMAPEDVRAAYERLTDRVGFWYS